MPSSARPPRRPPARGRYAHAPGVYRRRRIVLVTVLLLAGWGVVKLLPGGDEGDARPTSASTTEMPATPSPSAAPDKDPKSKAGKKAGKKTGKKAGAHHKKRKDKHVVRVNLSAPQGACDPATVTIAPSVRSGTYAGGVVPIRLAVTTTGTRACTLDLGAKDLLLEVDDGDGPVWEFSRCDEAPDQSVTVQPTWATTIDVSWSGRESRKGCKKLGDFLAPGDYTVNAALLGGEPGQAKFSLATRPVPKPEPKKKSEKAGKKHAGEAKDSGDDTKGSGDKKTGGAKKSG